MLPPQMQLKKYLAKAFETTALSFRGKIREMDKAYKNGQIREGDRVTVTYNPPNLLTRILSGFNENSYKMQCPESNIGIVSIGKTTSGSPFVTLHDSESSFSLDDRFSSWGTLD